MNIDLRVIAFLLSLGAAAFALILGVSVGAGEFLIPTLVVGATGVIVLLSNPGWAAAGAIATFSSGLTLPGLPGQMKLSDGFAAMLVAILVLQTAVRSDRRIPLSRLDWILIAFCGWIFTIGAYRGFGFLAFGGDMIGGFYYLRLLLAASLVITLPRIGIPIGSWKFVLLLVGLFAPATLVADLLVVRGWALEFVRMFVQTSGQVGTMVEEASADQGSTVGRLWSAGAAANGMLVALLCLVPMRRFFAGTGIHWLALFALVVTLSLLSGFRLMTATLVMIAVLTLYFQRGFTSGRLVALFVAGCVGLMVVYMVSMQLPNSVQRAISWLPGIEVSSVALADAEQTIDWRLMLWGEALRYFPDYWLIGKGFSYNKLEFISALQSNYVDGLQWALVAGAYHNGWLSMLLLTGLPGTVLCLFVLLGPIRLHWKRQWAPWQSEMLKRFHGVFLASLISTSAVFLIVYGDVHSTFPVLFFNWAVLETLARADGGVVPAGMRDDEKVDAESTYQEA